MSPEPDVVSPASGGGVDSGGDVGGAVVSSTSAS